VGLLQLRRDHTSGVIQEAKVNVIYIGSPAKLYASVALNAQGEYWQAGGWAAQSLHMKLNMVAVGNKL